jgi:hypothetical protein
MQKIMRPLDIHKCKIVVTKTHFVKTSKTHVYFVFLTKSSNIS